MHNSRPKIEHKKCINYKNNILNVVQFIIVLHTPNETMMTISKIVTINILINNSFSLYKNSKI